jgi:hypothetical protein
MANKQDLLNALSPGEVSAVYMSANTQTRFFICFRYFARLVSSHMGLNVTNASNATLLIFRPLPFADLLFIFFFSIAALFYCTVIALFAG